MIWLFGRRITEPPGDKRWQFLPRGIFETEAFMAIEHRPEFLRNEQYKKDFENRGSSSRILIRIEPPAVNPWQHRESITKDFGLVITESSSNGSNDWQAGYFAEGSLASVRKLSISNPFHLRPHDIAAVMANKFSFIEGELYTLRRRTWQALSASDIDFTLFGRDWDLKLHQLGGRLLVELAHAIQSGWIPTLSRQFPFRVPTDALGGQVIEPSDAYAKSRIAVVIENYPNRVTEKVYQAIESGCQVVYVGGASDWIDNAAPLVFRAEPKVESILETVRMALANQQTGELSRLGIAESLTVDPTLQMKSSMEALASKVLRFLG